MKNTNPLEKLNSSKWLLCAVFLCIFVIMLYCNIRTQLISDDFVYRFSFAEDRAIIDSFWDIFPSMAAHRNTVNGRVVSHFLVQLSLMLPLGIFKFLNSIVFTGLIYTLYNIAKQRDSHNILLLCCIFGCIWIFPLSFGQVILWQDGSINYLWASLFSLLFLSVYIGKFMYDKDINSLPVRIIFILAAVFVGAYSENFSSTTIFLSSCMLLLGKFLKKQKIAPYLWIAIILAFCGFLFMVTAPGEIANKSGLNNLSTLFETFVKVVNRYYQISVPLLIYIALAAVAYSLRIDGDTQILAFLFALGSFTASFVFIFAGGFPSRSTYASTIMLILANAVLFSALFSSRIFLKPALTALGVVCILFAFRVGCVGVKEIVRTDYLMTENVNKILASKDAGIMDVDIISVSAKDRHCALYDLEYAVVGEQDYWMAKYYGVDSIRGIY